MEIQTIPPKHLTRDYSSNVDTSSPFRSVKEAVAVFGERFLTPGIYSPKTFTLPKQETTSWSSTAATTFSPSPQNPKQENVQDSVQLETALKRLESELEETKMELKLLKERESETEVAIASLNAELHMNMSKMAQAEAEVAAKAVANRESLVFGGREKEEESSKRDLIMRMENSPTVAHILSQKEGSFGGGGGGGKGRKMTKKKPIIPLVWDFFSRKKGSSTGIHNPLYSSSFVQWN